VLANINVVDLITIRALVIDYIAIVVVLVEEVFARIHEDLNLVEELHF
jgi:hypothetical protein